MSQDQLKYLTMEQMTTGPVSNFSVTRQQIISWLEAVSKIANPYDAMMAKCAAYILEDEKKPK